jgi:hypothetical protein
MIANTVCHVLGLGMAGERKNSGHDHKAEQE